MRDNLGWYALVVTGLVAVSLLTATVAGPQILSDIRPKHQVMFFQTPTCGDLKEYAIPWAVRLGNDVKVVPTGAAVPSDDNRELSGAPFVPPNQTRIVFSVPDGAYNYTLMPRGDFWDPVTFPQGRWNGTIMVSSDVSINVTVANPGSCGF